MAEKKALFSNFAKKISQLNKANPKIVHRILKSAKTKDKNLTLNQVQPKINLPKAVTEPPQKNKKNSNVSMDDPSFIYENNDLKAYIERGVHKKEKKFALHDHLYYIKVEPKNDAFPLLINILDFIEQACNYIINEVKDSYELEANNIGLLTVYQAPMINGTKNTSKHLSNIMSFC